MEGLMILLGHLVGDYIFQNDWMAANKTNPHPGKRPSRPWRFGPAPIDYPNWTVDANPNDHEAFRKALEERNAQMEECGRRDIVVREKFSAWKVLDDEWQTKLRAYWLGHFACAVHCTWYTIAVWMCTFQWITWWGLVACWLLHYPVDRYRLAAWWMKNMSGQKAFATGPLAPWSVIVVDNILHLLVLVNIRSVVEIWS